MVVARTRQDPTVRQRGALLAVMLGASAGYYLASVVGLQLRLPPATTSVLWPPNAVLTTVLLLSPPRWWLLVLASALPVHITLQLPLGWPLPLILTLFVTNCSEALIAAGGLYIFSDAPRQFDTLRRLMLFLLFAGLLAPLLSSFADAAAVMWFRGESYWPVFQTRILSNILAELTVVPAGIGAVTGLMRGWRPRALPRLAEGALLGLGLFAIAWLNLRGQLRDIPALRVVSSQTPLAVQLPFLLWAAVRFGPNGLSVTLLATSLLSAWGVVNGVGPFASIPPATTVTATTIALIVVAIAMLCVATLIEERRQVQHALRQRLQFEELLSRLSAALVQLPSDRMDVAFEPWLGRIARVLGADGLTVFAVSMDDRRLTPIYNWNERESGGAAGEVLSRHLPWAQQSLSRPDVVVIPGDASGDGCAVALVGEDQTLGALALSSSSECAWSTDLVGNARLVAEVLASALRRKQTEDALRASELMKSAILQSLTSGVAVLDRSGALIQVNEKWVASLRVCPWMDVSIGGNLLDHCRRAAEAGIQLAEHVGGGVASVLDGSRERFIAEHMKPIEGTHQSEWWAITAVPLNRQERGAVVIHADITELRQAEVEAQRSRQELAHVSRLSTVGEMTASLAHQLNQPLAAIMTNAQVAQRILGVARPDLGELRAILQDIVKDDRRASDVIQRLRTLLRKGDLEMSSVDLKMTIREVVDLIGSEAIIRNTDITLDFAREPIVVQGDRVQLQQVILNLLHNAMEAMSDDPDAPRKVCVECFPVDAGRVSIRVRDSGPGLRTGSEGLIFEPFYTTKASGMGMGLSIVRTIVQAHGGLIHAANHPGRGAVFEILLPQRSDKAA
jgi:signal transduction histidine kinase/integral membrane sensor domain MASE1